MADMRVIVAGAGGRMGRALVKLIAETPGLKLVGAVECAESGLIGQDALALAGLPAGGVRISPDVPARAADAILDFTTPSASVHCAAVAAAFGLVHVIGTTGFSAADEEAIAAAARRTAIVKSGNMSLGVNLLAALVRRVAATLDAAFDIEIVEIHHRHKVDAPSGTALLLGNAAARGRDVELATARLSARDGHTGPRPPGAIGFAALRGGSVVGDHTVIFAGPEERLELTHRAEARSIFARGALTAALWARGKPPGLYGMADVLGLHGF
ncbi:MAG TPA: 4-hydroxy-tetrahydrodipicolinate reductase [Xanthobacteraceae bacterium]|nr:4-hydroxy-tetrahydrodipicolinate reductase [Xanthobacteraceae bacterium]